MEIINFLLAFEGHLFWILTNFCPLLATQWPMIQKEFSQTSQGAKLAANNLFLAAKNCKQIVYLLLKVFKRFSN